MKTTILCIVLTVFYCSMFSQTNNFVSLETGKFMLGCTEFYPVTVNYGITLIKEFDSDNYYPAAPLSRCSWHNDEGCNGSGNGEFSCADNKEDRRAFLEQDLVKIVELGFNSIRLVGLGVLWLPDGSIMVPDVSHETAAVSHCTTHGHTLAMNSQADYDKIINALQLVVNIIHNNPILKDLKIVLLTGAPQLNVTINHLPEPAYSSFLAALAKHFANEPVIFAYDLANEPSNTDYSNLTKNDVYNFVSTGCNAIRKNAPAHLITMGLHVYDVLKFDPAIMPIDFVSYHIYNSVYASQEPDFNITLGGFKSDLKFAASGTQKPWIIGEAGLPANDILRNTIPDIGYSNLYTEQNQEDFVKQTLDATRDCGGKGYSWWTFSDVFWGAPSLDPTNINQYWNGAQNTYGLIQWNYAPYFNMPKDVCDNSDVVEPFKQFQPFAVNTSGCITPANYYDQNHYNSYEVQGRVVYTNSDNSIVGIPNAIVKCWKEQVPSSDIHFEYSTYTDEDGNYILYTDPLITGNVVGISISAYGMNQTLDWGIFNGVYNIA